MGYMLHCLFAIFFATTLVTASSGSEKLLLSSCEQSSTQILHPGSHNLSCDKAIDGNVSQRLEKWSCSQVKETANGWWSARIDRPPLQITAVRIYNRIDYLTEALKDFSITVDGVECARYQSDVQFSVKTFNCHLIGQVVKIISRKSHLSLCEVEVFGKDFSKISIGANFTQRRVQQCLKSQFVKSTVVPLNNYERCATACMQHGSSCQGFELIGSGKRCQIFVFDKCSHKLTTENCGNYAWVYVRNKPGLPKGDLCPKDFIHAKFGSAYKLVRAKNWHDGHSLCGAEKGLSKYADASDKEEAAYMHHMRVYKFSTKSYFIGGSKDNNLWKWKDCNTPFMSDIWEPGQPNHNGPVANIFKLYRTGIDDTTSYDPSFEHALCECINPFA